MYFFFIMQPPLYNKVVKPTQSEFSPADVFCAQVKTVYLCSEILLKYRGIQVRSF